jgi:hypothetical protein
VTFDQYWLNLKERNPGLKLGDDSTMKISVASFEKSLRQAFEIGEQHGIAKQAKTNGLFGEIFGT